MKKSVIAIFAFVIICSILPLSQVDAKKTYTFRMGTQDASYEYFEDNKATMNFHASNLPLPGATFDLKNIEMHANGIQKITVSNYDSEADQMDWHISQEPGIIRLGYDFFQLPPMDTFMEEFLHEIGAEMPPGQSPFEPSDVTLQMTSRGELLGFDVELPEDAGMQGQMVMGMIENYITQMIEPGFPEDPISVGDTWSQKINLDLIPFAQLSPLFIDHKFEGVENEKGKDIGRVSFSCSWRQDINVFNDHIVGEKFEYYDQKEFEIVDFKLYIDIKSDGTFRFNITDGYTIKGRNESEIVMGARIDLKKLSGHNEGEIWSPAIEFSTYSLENAEIIDVK